MLKSLIVFAHLITVCMALGSVFVMDIKLLLWRKHKPNKIQLQRMEETQSIANYALIGLWITGAVIILYGYNLEGMKYVLNEKLWAKIFVVFVLTTNGFFLHKIAFPKLKHHALVDIPQPMLAIVMVMGAISSISWLFAAYLGIARHWSYSMPILNILVIYACLIITACIGAIVISRLLSRKQTNSNSSVITNNKQPAHLTDSHNTFLM